VEVYGKMELIVIKRNGSEENFDPEKIMQGLQRAVREDENHEQKIEMLMQEILQLVLEQRLKKISSRNIALIVMEKLKQADAIAYLRFASVHKNFHEAHEFEQEFKNLEK
jgi:transcriptional repressor NrdR